MAIGDRWSTGIEIGAARSGTSVLLGVTVTGTAELGSIRVDTTSTTSAGTSSGDTSCNGSGRSQNFK